MTASVTDSRIDPQLREILEICDELGPTFRAKLLRAMRLLPRCDDEARRHWRAMAADGAGVDEGLAFLEARARTH